MRLHYVSFLFWMILSNLGGILVAKRFVVTAMPFHLIRLFLLLSVPPWRLARRRRRLEGQHETTAPKVHWLERSKHAAKEEKKTRDGLICIY